MKHIKIFGLVFLFTNCFDNSTYSDKFILNDMQSENRREYEPLISLSIINNTDMNNLSKAMYLGNYDDFKSIFYHSDLPIYDNKSINLNPIDYLFRSQLLKHKFYKNLICHLNETDLFAQIKECQEINIIYCDRLFNKRRLINTLLNLNKKFQSKNLKINDLIIKIKKKQNSEISEKMLTLWKLTSELKLFKQNQIPLIRNYRNEVNNFVICIDEILNLTKVGEYYFFIEKLKMNKKNILSSLLNYLLECNLPYLQIRENFSDNTKLNEFILEKITTYLVKDFFVSHDIKLLISKYYFDDLTLPHYKLLAIRNIIYKEKINIGWLNEKKFNLLLKRSKSLHSKMRAEKMKKNL